MPVSGVKVRLNATNAQSLRAHPVLRSSIHATGVQLQVIPDAATRGVLDCLYPVRVC